MQTIPERKSQLPVIAINPLYTLMAFALWLVESNAELHLIVTYFGV